MNKLIALYLTRYLYSYTGSYTVRIFASITSEISYRENER